MPSYSRDRALAAGALCCACVLLMACGDDGADEGAGRGRGSPACQDWQDAVCDLAADRCGLFSRALCDAQYQGVVCRSDEIASQCSNALNEASCSAGPIGCDVPDIADPAPAIAACQDLLNASCARNERCGQAQPREQCLAEQQAQLGVDCQNAVSVDLRYEACLEMLEAEACGPIRPADCMGVIRVTL